VFLLYSCSSLSWGIKVTLPNVTRRLVLVLFEVERLLDSCQVSIDLHVPQFAFSLVVQIGYSFHDPEWS
jgi:hypothetical protein